MSTTYQQRRCGLDRNPGQDQDLTAALSVNEIQVSGSLATVRQGQASPWEHPSGLQTSASALCSDESLDQMNVNMMLEEYSEIKSRENSELGNSDGTLQTINEQISELNNNIILEETHHQNGDFNSEMIHLDSAITEKTPVKALYNGKITLKLLVTWVLQ